MKIGIVTFNSAHNYGAVLQAWSLQRFLEKQGHEVKVVNYRPWVIDDVYAMAVGKRFVENRRLNTAINRIRIVRNCIKNPVKFKRYLAFERFINKELNVTKVYRSIDEIRKDNSLHFDVLIAGSDQIWNSRITKQISPAYFLDFGGAEIKRISYAPSIGGKELPEVEKELFRSYLKNFDYLSVREENALKAIEPLTDQTVRVVADPTFLIAREDFDVLRRTFPVSGAYIYVHNVHLVREDIELNEVAEELSRKTGLPIVSNRKEAFFSNETAKFLKGNPGDFIGVIAGAEYVVTNSFHATVFSIIYHRKFVTIPHFSNPDRMQNLLCELGLSGHLISEASFLPDDLRVLEIDYKAVEERKEKITANSREFLKSSIEGPKKSRGIKAETAGPLYDTEGLSAFVNSGVEKQQSFIISTENSCGYRQDTLCDVVSIFMEKLLKEGGKCALPVFKEGMMTEYKVTDDPFILKKACLPEHVKSDPQEAFQGIKQLLEEGDEVLFVGNACRIASLKCFLKKQYQNLTLLETVCQGFAEPKIYGAYLKEMEDLYNSRLVKLELHNKFRKPDEAFVIYSFESGAVKVENALCEDLSVALSNHYIQEFPCYSCCLRNAEQGCGDISILLPEECQEFEAWEEGVKASKERQICLMRIHTQKGKQSWQRVQEGFEVQETEGLKFMAKHVKMNYTRNRIEQELQMDKSMRQAFLKRNTPKKQRR